MGAKCVKQITVINAVQSPQNSHHTKYSAKTISKEETKSKGSSSLTVKTKQINNSQEMVSHEPLVTNSTLNQRKTLKDKIITNESLACNEGQILDIIKGNNKALEDIKLIDNCLTHHFFMKNLDKPSRYSKLLMKGLKL